MRNPLGLLCPGKSPSYSPWKDWGILPESERPNRPSLPLSAVVLEQLCGHQKQAHRSSLHDLEEYWTQWRPCPVTEAGSCHRGRHLSAQPWVTNTSVPPDLLFDSASFTTLLMCSQKGQWLTCWGVLYTEQLGLIFSKCQSTVPLVLLLKWLWGYSCDWKLSVALCVSSFLWSQQSRAEVRGLWVWDQSAVCSKIFKKIRLCWTKKARYWF